MMSRVVLLSCVLMLASIPVVPQEDSPPLPKHFARCTATNTIVCVDGECKEVSSTVFFLLGSEGDKKTYSRCDRQGSAASLRPSSLSSSKIGPFSSTVGCQPLPTR